jgi:hypothetical protein
MMGICAPFYKRIMRNWVITLGTELFCAVPIFVLAAIVVVALALAAQRTAA